MNRYRLLVGFGFGLALIGGGCQELSLPGEYEVRVASLGVIEPVVLALDSPGGTTQLVIDAADELVFDNTLLRNGDPYVVTMVSVREECTVVDGEGVVEGEHVQVTVVCGMLRGLALLGDDLWNLGFSPTELSYRRTVPVFSDDVALVATPIRADVTIEIAGEPVSSGVPSAPIPVLAERTVIPIVARHAFAGREMSYWVVIDREDAPRNSMYSKSSEPRVGDAFGHRVAMSADGETMVVAAVYEDRATATETGEFDVLEDSGAVYVFRRRPDGWTQDAVLEAFDARAGDRFGAALAISASGDTVAVGASSADGDQAERSGAVYVFHRSGSNFLLQARLAPGQLDTDDGFGASVSLSADGTRLAVGAPAEDSSLTGVHGFPGVADQSASESGAVFLFHRDGLDWQQQGVLFKASNTDAGDGFGYRVALSGNGNVLAVSALFEDSLTYGIDGHQASNALTDSGAVYVFHWSSTAWRQDAFIKAFSPGRFDNFGSSVALNERGNVLAVGAMFEDSSTGTAESGATVYDEMAPNSGSVYVYERHSGLWEKDSYLKSDDVEVGAMFGASVALNPAGTQLAVGAIGQSGTSVDGSDEPVVEAGAVYLLSRGEDGWMQRTSMQASDPGPRDHFGHDITVVDDRLIAVGAPGESGGTPGVDGDQSDNSQRASGAAYLFW